MNRDLFSFIDGAEALAVELETGLSKIPAISPESGGEGELDKCLWLEVWLRDHGITELERHDAPDPRAKGGVRPNLVATLPGETAGGVLWIMSHIDVVPPGDLSLWTGDPWTVRLMDGPQGKRLVGRGVEDNQQGLVSSVLAALAFLRSGLKPVRTVKLLFCADEECGSEYGVIWLAKNRDLFRPEDVVLIPDSGDADGAAVEVAEKNLLWAKFTVRGAQAHGSRPDLGRNAHLAAADLALSLHHGLNEKFSARDPLFEPDLSTFEPTKKEANVPNINTIPPEDVFYMDCRILPRYPLGEIFAEMDRICAEIEGRRGVTISRASIQAAESPATPVDSPFIRDLGLAIREVYGVEAHPVGIGGGTVAAVLRTMGLHCAVWARLCESAHQIDEFALVSSILGDAKVMALLMSGR